MSASAARRIAASVVLAILALTALSGCSPEAQIFAKVASGNLQFKICDSIEATRIAISTSNPGALDYTEVWVAKGQSALERGDTIDLQHPPDGMEGDGEVDIRSDELDVQIEISGTYEDGTSTILVATFAAGLILDDSWASQTSSRVGTAC